MKHRIVLAVIVRDDRVLLGHRAPTRAWYANCWDVIGGHIELGESSERVLVRECHEELGITVQRYQPVPVTLSDAEIDPSAFLVTQWEGEIRNMAPEEHDALRWFGPEDLGQLHLADPVYVDWLQGLLKHFQG